MSNSFLDKTGLQKVWNKIVSLFVNKNDYLSDADIEDATTGGGSQQQSVDGMTVRDYIDARLQNIEADTISANEISVTSGNSLILGGDSYDNETGENEWFEIKCPKRPYFNINGNIYNLPWEEQNGVDVNLAKANDVGIEKFRISGRHRMGEDLIYYDEEDYYTELLDYTELCRRPGQGENSRIVAYRPIYKWIIIENYTPELLDSNKYRVFFMRWGKVKTRMDSETLEIIRKEGKRWKVKCFSAQPTNHVQNLDWWAVQGQKSFFFGSEENSHHDYYKIYLYPRGNEEYDIRSVSLDCKIGCAIFEKRDSKWIRVSNIAVFRLVRHLKHITVTDGGKTVSLETNCISL